MGLQKAWYTLAQAGVYRMTEAGFGPTAHRTVPSASPIRATRPTTPHTVIACLTQNTPGTGPCRATPLTRPPIGVAR
ncbi:hypothetical protein [Streptomyces niveus]|uniref:hypothetical protein n=1 Tax=Streptomyces niveus TaxID=193462 RepID=UPI00114CA4B3|nr:hypothetical protein [Streptomyces niveus]